MSHVAVIPHRNRNENDVVVLMQKFQELSLQRDSYATAMASLDGEIETLRQAVLSHLGAGSAPEDTPPSRPQIRGRGRPSRSPRMTTSQKERVQSLAVEAIRGAASMSASEVYNYVSSKVDFPLRSEQFGTRFLKPLVEDGTLSRTGHRRGTRYSARR